MNFNIIDGIGRLFAALPRRVKASPPLDGVREDSEQSKPAGLVSDFAIDRFTLALSRVPDPDDVLRRAGMSRHDLKRLEFDDEISGALDTRREAAITTPWRLDGAQAGTERSKFVTEELRRVFDPFMRGCWDAVPYGYSVCEAVYTQRDDGRIGIGRMMVKPMQWFEPMRDGRLVLTRPSDGARIDADTRLKFCLTRRNGTYANPFGDALLSRLYWAWYFRTYGWKAWIQFVERFGDPFVVGKSDNPKELVSALLGMGVKNVIGVGSDDDVQVLMPASDGAFDRLDQRLTDRIVKVILGQTLTSGAGDRGSYALGKVHENVRQDKRRADVRMMRGSGQWLVNALWSLNDFVGAPPTFTFDDQADIEPERALRDQGFKTSGVVRKFSEGYLRRTYGFDKGDIEAGH